MQETQVHGVVVEQPGHAAEVDAGYALRTDEGRLLALAAGHLDTPLPLEQQRHQNHEAFAPWLGQAITVHGYLERETLYNAMVADLSDDDPVQMP